jgi:hypothetical protein
MTLRERRTRTAGPEGPAGARHEPNQRCVGVHMIPHPHDKYQCHCPVTRPKPAAAHNTLNQPRTLVYSPAAVPAGCTGTNVITETVSRANQRKPDTTKTPKVGQADHSLPPLIGHASTREGGSAAPDCRIGNPPVLSFSHIRRELWGWVITGCEQPGVVALHTPARQRSLPRPRRQARTQRPATTGDTPRLTTIQPPTHT